MAIDGGKGAWKFIFVMEMCHVEAVSHLWGKNGFSVCQA